MRHILRDSLKNAGYSLKERSKIYATSVAGTILPLVWMRYGCVPYQPLSSDIETEAGKWMMAAVYSSIPSVVGAFAGLFLGVVRAHSNRGKNMGKESKLENEVKGGNN